MPLQDLTPELRTRLSAVERTVGWFVMLASIILVVGFGFYIYQTGKAKGWFITKINYATGLNDAAGIHPGDPVTLMGFNVGEIVRIQANEPDARWGVTVFFWVRADYPGYIWLDSRIKVNQDFLGHSSLEIVKGHTGAATAWFDKDKKEWMVLRSRAAFSTYKSLTLTNKIDPLTASNILNGLIRSNKANYYVSLHDGKFNRPADDELKNWVYVPSLDSTPLADRLAAVANTVEAALPNILNLTNQLSAVLTNAAAAVARLDNTLADAHPIVTNLAVITDNLRDTNGSLGNWIIPPSLSAQLANTLSNASVTLAAAHTTLDTTDTNLTAIATDLDHTLDHLADLTSNLAWQVQINTNLVSEISTTIVHTDDLIQGLKRHWFLRSAFKHEKTKPADKAVGH